MSFMQAKYVGPRPEYSGKDATIELNDRSTDSIYALFDDGDMPFDLAHSWHLFPRSDFQFYPQDRDIG